MTAHASAARNCARVALPARRLLACAACNNSPYPTAQRARRTRCSIAFDERSPRYLDPTASYANPRSPYTYQIYEPLYGYHYLKRPYQLVPKAAAEVAHAALPRQGRQAAARRRAAEQIAESVYDMPHQAAASCTSRTRRSPRTRKGEYLLPRADAAASSATGARRWDFEQQGTRELVADDFVYALKRHATHAHRGADVRASSPST